MLGVQPPQEPRARLAWEVERVADRLRSLSLARLAAPLPPDASRADAAHGLAQRLADAAADLEGRERIDVPRLGDHVVGDQVAVTGQDLVAAAGVIGAGEERAAAVLVDAIDRLRDLRLRL